MTNRKSAQPLGHRVRRIGGREFMFLLAGATTAPRILRAQQKAMPLVAFRSPRTFAGNIDAFRRGLRELGYVDGQNIALEVRSAEGDNRRLPALAAELAALKPDVIVTNSEPAIRAVKEVAGTIPIVMSIVSDAVALGFAQSLAHPGGNLTGQTILSTDLIGKRLQMLLEIVPEPRLCRGVGRSRRQLRQGVTGTRCRRENAWSAAAALRSPT